MLLHRKQQKNTEAAYAADREKELLRKKLEAADGRIKDLEKELANTRGALSAAEAESRAKTRFLSAMSHDIRTPMNAITGFTRLAKKYSGNREMVRDYLDKISSSSDHLLMLINDVLDISRIESGTMAISAEAEKLSSIVHGLRDLVRQNAQTKGLDFSVDAYDVVHEDIFCDRLHLNEVLLNQLSNAVKYTPAGSVAFSVRELEQLPDGYGQYEFRIKDTGIGMSADFLKNIYEPFCRAEEASSMGIQGTGLGMAITAKLVELMHGTIVINSVHGEGTEVILTFPFRLAEGSASAETAAYMGTRALVCSANAEACRYISGILGRNGFRTEWCLTGKEASIRTLEAEQDGSPFGLFLVDWSLPGEKSLEILGNIRRIAGDGVPLVVMSDADEDTVRKKVRDLNVNAVVGKPLFPSDFNDFLAGITDRTREPEEAAGVRTDFSGRHILIAEDNELNLEIATDVLEEYGLVVTPAVNGAEAVEKILASSPGDFDLVLMDIQMPVMDGYEATAKIRAAGGPLSRVPIVAMTANAFAEDRQAALDKGMDDHLTKPIEIDRLNVILGKYLR